MQFMKYMPTEYSALFSNSSSLPLLPMLSGLQQKQDTRHFAFAIDLCDEAEGCNQIHNHFWGGKSPLGLLRMISETAEALNCYWMTWILFFFLLQQTRMWLFCTKLVWSFNFSDILKRVLSDDALQQFQNIFYLVSHTFTIIVVIQVSDYI